MSSVKSEHGFAKIDGQADEVFYGSPLAMIGIYVEVIRARFRGMNNGTPWLWKDDPRPAPDETGEQGAPRSLLIESGLNDDPEARNFRPAIYVEKEETRYNKVVVGDRHGIHRPTRYETFFALTEIPMTIECVSTNKAESAVIADHTWFHLIAAKNIIRSTFLIHAITDYVLGKTQPYRRSPDTPDSWMTPITFSNTVEIRWITEPMAPRLEEILLNFQITGSGDPFRGAVQTALTNRSRR